MTFWDQTGLSIQRRPLLRADVGWVLSVFLIWRGLLTLWAGLVGPGLQRSPFEGNSIYEVHWVALPSRGPLSDFLLAPWYRWDAGHYMKIAVLGYDPDDASTVFPPLYPLVTRLITPLAFGNTFLAGLLVANAACVGALVLLLRDLTPHVGSDRARWTIITLIAFPTAFFLVSAYTESLYLFLALAALSAMRQRWWALAGSAALLAGLTRFQGVALVLPLAWEWWQSHRSHLLWRDWFKLLPAAGAPLGTAGFLLWTHAFNPERIRFGYTRGFQQDFSLPWNMVWQSARFLLSGQAILPDWINALTVGLSLCLCVWMMKRLPAAYWLYSWATLLVPLALVTPTQPFRAFVRYVIVNFPLFVMLADLVYARRRLRLAMLIGLSLLQLLFVWLYTHWFWVA